MKITISVHDFRESFARCGRQEQFSYDGLGLLFDHLEQLEGDTGQEMELDVIAICCDFAESSPRQFADYYSLDIGGLDDDEIAQAVRDELDENGNYVGETDAGDFVYYQY